MATSYTSNKKIGALDSASTPLAATNEIVINQNGDILKTPLSAVEAKIFDAKTALTPVAGTEVVVVRQTDNVLRQVALDNIIKPLLITNAMVSESANIVDTKLATINTAGKVTNNAVQATPALSGGAYNSGLGANKIVTRDGSGNFAAGTVTATLSGNASTATTLQTGRTIALTGDVTYTSPSFDGSANVTAASTIANNAVTTAKIADSNVTTAKIADSNVTTAKIADSNVTTAKIADSNVTTAKIADSAVTSAKVANDAIDNTKIRNSAALSVIGRSANSTGDPEDIAAGTDGHVLRRSGTGLGFGQVVSAGIATGAVTATELASNAVTTVKILDANVTTAKIADANVTTAKIADANVTAVKIANANVTLEKLAAAVQEFLVPVGAIQPFARAASPSGWLACDGQAVSRTGTYAALFAAIGTAWGAGDGTNTFNVPDLRDRYLRHAGPTFSGSVGTRQADEIKSHTHSVSGNTGTQSSNHYHSVSATVDGTTGFQSNDHTHNYYDQDQVFENTAGFNGVGGGTVTEAQRYEVYHNYSASRTTAGQNQNHNHSFSTSFSTTSGLESTNHTHQLSVTSGATGGSETRPYSATVLYCIKF